MHFEYNLRVIYKRTLAQWCEQLRRRFELCADIKGRVAANAIAHIAFLKLPLFRSKKLSQ